MGDMNENQKNMGAFMKVLEMVENVNFINSDNKI